MVDRKKYLKSLWLAANKQMNSTLEKAEIN